MKRNAPEKSLLNFYFYKFKPGEGPSQALICLKPETNRWEIKGRTPRTNITQPGKGGGGWGDQRIASLID